MTLILLYLVVLVLVAVVLFGVASVAFGRGERLPPLPTATTATMLPAYDVTAADVDAVRFAQTLRTGCSIGWGRNSIRCAANWRCCAPPGTPSMWSAGDRRCRGVGPL